MELSTATTTIATIASICENSRRETKDYLDIITPFIIQCLPSTKGSPVDLLYIKSRMEKEFSFHDIPVGVIKTILLRIASKKDAMLAIEGDTQETSFRMIKTNIKNNFKKQTSKSKEDMESVLNALIQYLYNEYNMHCDDAKAKELLFQTFDAFYDSILDSEKGIFLGSITSKEKRRVAKFIWKEKQKSSVTFDKIVNLASGYIVYQAIYYYEKQTSFITTASLENIIIYLDTPVLIDALDYRSTEGTKTVCDLIKLIEKLGGRVRIHTHVIEELRGILEAYCDDYPNVNKFKLDNLLSKYRSKIAILTISEKIETEIKARFEIDDAPPLGIMSDWEILNNEEAIKRFYHISIEKMPVGEQNIGRRRAENDIRSLMAIIRLRNGDIPTSLCSCKALLLSDSKTARKVYAYLRNGTNEKEVNLVYSVIDLSCALWLSSTRNSTELNKDILLYSVMAAIDANDQVVKRMLQYTAELEAAGKITPEIAVAIRSKPRAKQIIAELSENDELSVSKEKVVKVADHLLVEEQANKKAQPIIKKWRKITNIAVCSILWLLLTVIIILPWIFIIIKDANDWTLIAAIISISGLLCAIIQLAEKYQIIRKCGRLASNLVEEMIESIELKIARKHAEYFLE